MGRRKTRWTPELIARRIAEGRGQGEGYKYTPWLRIQDFPSSGRVHRIKGWKHGRVHHLFSDLERDIFLTYEWQSEIIDIKEQYPLLPLEETLWIAKRLGIRHPSDPRTKHPVVMTTDFLLMSDIKLQLIYSPITTKYLAAFEDPRAVEKLEIERRYWQARGKDLVITTEQQVTKPFVQNMRWVHPRRSLTDMCPLSKEKINRIAFSLTKTVRQKDAPLRDITRDCDTQLGLARGRSLSVVRHLIANKWWKVDMTKPIQQGERLILLNNPKAELYWERRKTA